MRLGAIVPALLALAACDQVPDTDETDTDTSTGVSCPGSLEVPSQAGATPSQLQVDGITLIAGFDATAVYDGVPSACIDPDGTEAFWTLEVGGAPFLTVSMRAEEAGYHDLTGDEGSLNVSVFGTDEPVVFRSSHWQTGTWYVPSVGNTLQLELQEAYALTEEARTLRIALFASASP